MTQYSKAPTTLDQLIRSQALLDCLGPKQGLLANSQRRQAVAVSGGTPNRVATSSNLHSPQTSIAIRIAELSPSVGLSSDLVQ
ncbi:hypothetical protein SH501x_005070 [Pirellulaceae bacterium SH501]